MTTDEKTKIIKSYASLDRFEPHGTVDGVYDWLFRGLRGAVDDIEHERTVKK